MSTEIIRLQALADSYSKAYQAVVQELTNEVKASEYLREEIEIIQRELLYTQLQSISSDENVFKTILCNFFELQEYKVLCNETLVNRKFIVLNDKNDVKTFVQCDLNSKTVVDIGALQEFASTMLAETISKGIYIATGIFTMDAEYYVDSAKSNEGLQVVD